jgi:hypothetical protein
VLDGEFVPAKPEDMKLLEGGVVAVDRGSKGHE